MLYQSLPNIHPTFFSRKSFACVSNQVLRLLLSPLHSSATGLLWCRQRRSCLLRPFVLETNLQSILPSNPAPHRELHRHSGFQDLWSLRPLSSALGFPSESLPLEREDRSALLLHGRWRVVCVYAKLDCLFPYWDSRFARPLRVPRNWLPTSLASSHIQFHSRPCSSSPICTWVLRPRRRPFGLWEQPFQVLSMTSHGLDVHEGNIDLSFFSRCSTWSISST